MQRSRQFLLALFLLTGSISFSQKITVNLKNSDKYTVQNTTETNSSAEVMGQSMETTADSKTSTTYQVMASKATEIALVATITKMAIKASAMGQESTFDSDKNDNEGPLAQELSSRINKSRNMTIDLKGKIIKQDKQEELPGQPVGSNDETIIEFIIPALIGKELKTGSSIPYTDSIKTEKSTTHNFGTYTVTKIENGVASISYTGTTKMSGTMEQMGMEMKITSNGQVSSEIQLDIKTGTIKEESTVTDSKMTIETAGMSIPTTAKAKKTLRVSKE